jgi:hypothetical protein
MHPAQNRLTITTIALLLALTACSGADPAPQADPSPVSDDAPTTPPSETPVDAAPTDLVGVQGPLEPGRYSMAAWGQNEQAGGPLPRAVLDVPEGYFSNGGYVVDAGLDGVTDDQRGDLSVWHAVQVLADPCEPGSAATVGPTVEDLARALVRQAGPSTRPRPVVLDGHRGLAMEITVPPDADLTRCPFAEYSLFRTEARGDSAYSPTTPGLVNHLWILDVDGTRLVVVAALYPDEDPALHQEQLAIAESIHFVDTGA